MTADDIFAKAAESVTPKLAAVQFALWEQAMAKGIQAAVDTMRALADDAVAGKVPKSEVLAAAMALERAAEKKREAAKAVLAKMEG